MPGNDEEIPYRSDVPASIMASDATTHDEDQYDTLKSVYVALKASVDDLDKWHAFDLKEEDGLDIKQQIVAHRLASDILTPLLDSVESALATVDDKYRNR